MTKHFQSNMTEWYNKIASTYSRISSQSTSDGKRLISSMMLGVLLNETGNALVSKDCKARHNPMNRMRKTVLQTARGSKVFCRYGSSEWSYVAQIESVSGNNINIRYLDGSKGTEPKSSICNYELIEGDVIYMKGHSGEIVKRWIIRNDGSTMLQVEDIKGNQSNVYLKDLRFK